MQLPPYPHDSIPYYTGKHPGTGTNDHIHHWEWYRLGHNPRVPTPHQLIVACQICGITRRELMVSPTE
jgi:hypothetical protein